MPSLLAEMQPAARDSMSILFSFPHRTYEGLLCGPQSRNRNSPKDLDARVSSNASKRLQARPGRTSLLSAPLGGQLTWLAGVGILATS